MSTLGDRSRTAAQRVRLGLGVSPAYLDALAAEVDALEAERDEWKRQADKYEVREERNGRDLANALDDLRKAQLRGEALLTRALDAEEERDTARRELDELRQRVKALAAQKEAVIQRSLDRDLWNPALERERALINDFRAALDPAPPHQDARTGHTAPNSTPGHIHATQVATTPHDTAQSNNTQEDA